MADDVAESDTDTDDAPEPVRLRHEGRATVWGGPADLGATDPDDVVAVTVEEAAHYVEYHGFVRVESDDADDDDVDREASETPHADGEAVDVSHETASEVLADADYRELQALAREVDGVAANQSADDLRDALAEHYESDNDVGDTET